MLTETTRHKEMDQQIVPTSDPLSNFFSRRKLTADFEENAVFFWRPLSLDNALVFEVKTPDAAWFMDIESLRLTFEGTVRELDAASGLAIDLEKEPETEFRAATEDRWVTSVKEPTPQQPLYTVKSMETKVEHQREFLKGLLVTPAPQYDFNRSIDRLTVVVADCP